jgi:hypothetical protein
MADMLPTTLCSSRFELLMRWLRLPALTTLWPVLPVNHPHAAFFAIWNPSSMKFPPKIRKEDGNPDF